jgi:integrase/recombinase XerD
MKLKLFMGKLKDQMIEDMKLRNFSPQTIKSYISSVTSFVRYFKASPEELTDLHIKEYLTHLLNTGASWSTINAAQSSLKQLYIHILKQNWKVEKLKRPRKEKRLPEVLSVEEVELIINCVDNIKHKAILMTLYSTGIRLGELCKIRLKDIDKERKVLRVVCGKGKKDRQTILSEKLLTLLRTYYKIYKPEEFLFNGYVKGIPVADRTVQHIFRKAALKAKVKKDSTVHTLRHSFATHLLENGVDIFTISKLLGHTSIKTTTIYLHLQRGQINSIVNPLDKLNIKI